MGSLRSLLVVAGLSVLVACGGSSSGQSSPSGSLGLPQLSDITIERSGGITSYGYGPIPITRGGYTGPVTLSVTGAPVGVSGGFAESTTTADAVPLHLDINGFTVAGVYPITLRATAPGLSAAASTFVLTVTPGPAIGAECFLGYGVVELDPDVITAMPLHLIRSGGYTGQVNFSLAGAPSGVMAAFQAVPGSADEYTMSLKAVGAAAGTYPVELQYTEDGLPGVNQIPFSLIISGPDQPSVFFSAATPSLTLARGGQVSASIGVNRRGGYMGYVGGMGLQSILGPLPMDISATFASDPVAGDTNQLTLRATPYALPGTYWLTVYGNILSPGYAGETVLKVTVTP